MQKNKQYYYYINVANYSAYVYLNVKKLAHHDGGYSTFRVDLTRELKEENLLAVIVDNQANDTIYPQNADFTFYGGLYRDVNIIAVDDTHFDLMYRGSSGIMVTPEIKGNDADVKVEVFLTDAKEGQKLRYVIKDQEGTVVTEQVQPVTETKTVFTIPKVHLWNGRTDPYLYTPEVSIL